MPVLRLTRGGVEIQNVDLSQLGKTDVIIGRAEDADVRLDDRAVGRSHAVLRLGAKGVAIQKTSKFGKLTLNGHDVSEALIHEGDVVHLADYTVHIIQDTHVQRSAADLASPSLEPAFEVNNPLEEKAEVSGTAVLDLQGIAAEVPAAPLAAIETASAAAVTTQAITAPAEPQADAKLVDVPVEAVLTGQLDLPQQQLGNNTLGNIDAGAPLSSQETGSLPQNQNIGEAGTQSLDVNALDAQSLGSQNIELIQNNTQSESGGELGPEDRTAILPQGQVAAELIFKPGEASVENFEVQKNEVSIGRGSNCDVVLGDKKASRKHAVVRRAGAVFVIRDLGSANGTYLNGEQITEKEIQGGDMIRIGDTEFVFRAVSKAYEAQQGDLLSVPSVEQSTGKTPQVEMPSQASGVAYAMNPASSNGGGGGGTIANYMSGAEALAAQASIVNQQAAAQGIPGIAPNMAAAAPPNKSLLAKFRKLSPVTRYAIMLFVMLFFYYGSEEMDKQNAKNGRSPASAKAPNDPENAAFNALAPEKRQFVLNTYQLAFDLYTQEKYEEALYEIRKVLQVLPSGYKQAKDIESYAQKAIEQLAEQAERRKRQENEEKVRAEVASLVAQAQDLVDKGNYADARNVFSQILEKDPENPVVQRLKSEIDEKEEQARVEEEAKKEKLAKKELMQKLLNDGHTLLREKKYYAAIDRMADAPTIGYQDEAMLHEVHNIVKEAKRLLLEDTKPFLDEAQAALTSGNLPKARDAFLKALKVDYKNAQAKAGLEGVRKTLFEKARRIYTEGLIAESISNYKEARAKFGRCLEVAMPDDIYHGRCERKYKRYDFLDRSIASDSVSDNAGAADAPVAVPEGGPPAPQPGPSDGASGGGEGNE